MLFATFLLIVVYQVDASQNRYRRQYAWNAVPYFEGSHYWDQQEQQQQQNQWNSGYQRQMYNNGQYNNAQYQQSGNYYQPQYGYQNTWQYSHYNSPSDVYQTSPSSSPPQQSRSQDSYVTGPPDTLPSRSSYSRPVYLATMHPKPTLPVVLERTTVFVTEKPIVAEKPQLELVPVDVHHPTFLERVFGTPLPAVVEEIGTTTISDIDEFFKKDEESELPTRGESEEKDESNEDKIPTPQVFERPVALTTETVETTTPIEIETTESSSTVTITAASETTTTEEPITESMTTQEPESTSSIPVETTTSTTTATTTTAEAVPVTLIATQQVDATTSDFDKDYDLNKLAVTDISSGLPTDKIEVEDEEGSGSGSEEIESHELANSTATTTFTDGIIGMRPPPLPKEVDNTNKGIEVAKWSDSDNFIKKLIIR